MMFTCFPEPLIVMKHAFDNLAPGGWIEFQDGRLKFFQANPDFQGDAVQRWSNGCVQGAANMGRDIECVLKYEGWLKEAGFINITQMVFMVPTAEWHSNPKLKRIGMYMQQNMLQGLQGMWKMLRQAGMTPTEVETLLNQARCELLDPANHAYCNYITVFAQKPRGQEPS
ncbi:hypothetical protein BX600DRAFT_464356 [Xylariales sp. PMI_506]|nr:hypothetical protein BX600DRAFT_464356 [Xylariales sp. PMI_506]